MHVSFAASLLPLWFQISCEFSTSHIQQILIVDKDIGLVGKKKVVYSFACIEPVWRSLSYSSGLMPILSD